MAKKIGILLSTAMLTFMGTAFFQANAHPLQGIAKQITFEEVFRQDLWKGNSSPRVVLPTEGGENNAWTGGLSAVFKDMGVRLNQMVPVLNPLVSSLNVQGPSVEHQMTPAEWGFRWKFVPCDLSGIHSEMKQVSKTLGCYRKVYQND